MLCNLQDLCCDGGIVLINLFVVSIYSEEYFKILILAPIDIIEFFIFSQIYLFLSWDLIGYFYSRSKYSSTTQ